MSPDPLARRPTDTAKSWWALQDYAAMGAARSLATLADRYRSSTDPVPTRRLQSLKEWSAAHAWQERVSQIRTCRAQVVVANRRPSRD